MHAPHSGLVGREDELEAIVRLLDGSGQQPGAAVLCGEPGIGKTELWLAGLRAAHERRMRVLSTRPGETETAYTYAGLTDLLEPSLHDVLPDLPPVQRQALETALLLGESAIPADERTVASACLGAIRLLARGGPVLLAVDDLQWLDRATVAVLRFVLARLEDSPVASLLTVRGDPPGWLRRVVQEQRLLELRLGGLSVGALHELLQNRLDATFPRPTLLRIVETAGGNPLFAVELAAALQDRGGALAPGEPLPVPADLQELLKARLRSLGPAATAVLQVVAAVAEATVDLVEATLGAPCEEGLSDALAAGVLELRGPYLRFTHPLFGSVAVAQQTPAGRRSLHRRLAELAPSAEERARHLALATTGPDSPIAWELEAAARAAQARGAPAAAAELAEEALRLTPPSLPDDARRRLLLAAELHHHAGDAPRATALLEAARRAATAGRDRASVVAQLAQVQPRPHDAVALLREALPEAEGDDALQAAIHLHLALLMRFTEGIERGMEHGELAVRAARLVDDPSLRCRALAAFALMYFNTGRGIPAAELEEALALERTLPERPLDDGPTWTHAWQLSWWGDLDRARTSVLAVLEFVRGRNDAAQEADALWYLGLLETRAANWETAERYAAASLDLWTQLGRVIPPHHFPLAIAEAHLGRVDEARARSQRALEQAVAEGVGIGESGHSWVLGFVELSTGDAAAALPHLRRAHELRDAFMLEPAQRLELGDLLEALVAVGELDEAEAVLVPGDERARGLDRAWALAILARCRALLLAARGEVEAAFPHFDRALAEHARSTDPFQHARTLLALGATQRRAKRRAAARDTLGEALGGFERLGAPLWAEQARAELARIGGRTPTGDELTEAESRIAALVAEGKTNREVAAALFLTVHSVETALTRIYRKLGVRSRAELARRYPAKT